VSVADTSSCHSREGGNPVILSIRPVFLYTIVVCVFPQQELISRRALEFSPFFAVNFRLLEIRRDIQFWADDPLTA
jgi:hypothetical protein